MNNKVKIMKAINIKWDTCDEDLERIMDSPELGLPNEVIIPDDVILECDNDDINDYYSDVADWLSNEYGFCLYGFDLLI